MKTRRKLEFLGDSILSNLADGYARGSLVSIGIDGGDNEALGESSVALGQNTKAYRKQDIAIGGKTQAGMTEAEFNDRYKDTPAASKPEYGDFSGAFATGELTKALARGSTTFGFNTTTIGEYSIASGYESTAVGQASFASGKNTRANAEGSATFGFDTLAKGVYSTAFGFKSQAHGQHSIAGGNTCTVNGNNSFAMGYKSTCPGNNSLACGYFVNAVGDNSVAIGSDLYAKEPNQAVFGIRNADNPNALFIVGYGVDDTKRNAFEVLKDGRARVYGEPVEDNDVVRWQEKKELEDKITLESNSRGQADGQLQNNINVVNNNLTNHKSNKTNPHNVTKTQLGLGNVANYEQTATPTSASNLYFTAGGAYNLQTKIDNFIDSISWGEDTVNYVPANHYLEFNEPGMYKCTFKVRYYNAESTQPESFSNYTIILSVSSYGKPEWDSEKTEYIEKYNAGIIGYDNERIYLIDRSRLELSEVQKNRVYFGILEAAKYSIVSCESVEKLKLFAL